MSLEEKIVGLLSTSDAMKSGEMAEALTADKKEVDKAIKSLTKEEKIISPKRCYYSVKK